MTLTSREEKANAAKSCSLQLSWERSVVPSQQCSRQLEPIFQIGFVNIDWFLPEAAEAGHFTFLFSQRVCSGRDRCAVGLDWLHQDCCWGWVQVSGLEEYTLWKHMAHLKTSSFVNPSWFSCWALLKVSYKSQMHIAIYSCPIKKWARMILQKIILINNADIISLETSAVRTSSSTQDHFTFPQSCRREVVPLVQGYDNRFSWVNSCEFNSNAALASSLLGCCLCSPFQLALFSPTCPSIVCDSLVSENLAHSVNKGSTR